MRDSGAFIVNTMQAVVVVGGSILYGVRYFWAVMARRRTSLF